MHEIRWLVTYFPSFLGPLHLDGANSFYVSKFSCKCKICVTAKLVLHYWSQTVFDSVAKDTLLLMRLYGSVSCLAENVENVEVWRT